MKTLFTLISGLLAGLAIYSPISDIQHLWANRKKVLWAAVIFAAAFVFLMAAILIGAIESALQMDAQGFVIWSAMYSLTVWLALAAVAAFAGGKILIPRAPRRSMVDWGAHLGLVDKLEDWLTQIAPTPAPSPAARAEVPIKPPAADQFSPIHREQSKEKEYPGDKLEHTH